jgi:2-oxo-4-hydroxy-4-carboxy-5-ureidoimidazoline decarboxylase
MTLRELNAMDREAFIAAFGWVFEHSPWVAERAWNSRPFESLAGLHGAMAKAVEQAAAGEQLALIRAHPDLGTRTRMSDASTGEQSGAGLDRLTPSEYDQLIRLNSVYREKFGFPFIYAVKGSTKQDVLRALESRLAGDAATERATALTEIYRIAQFRLEEMFFARVQERQ